MEAELKKELKEIKDKIQEVLDFVVAVQMGVIKL